VAGRAGQLVNTEAAAARQGARTIAGFVETSGRALGAVHADVEAIAAASADIDAQGRALLASVAGLASGVEQSGANLRTAGGQLGTLRDGAEALIGLVADAGVETPDTRFIHAVQAAAAEVARRFEAGLARGDVTADALFDRDYRPIAGSDPAQVLTRGVAFTDRVLPGVQEPMLAFDPRVVFCAAVDVNGYLPTHNRKYSQPQRRGDSAWNAGNCRNRRVFDDRVGLAAGRNQGPFLLQTYRRDMGGGRFALMKDLSAPIVVRGRHWGGLRLAYAVDE
jgi:methyl-accepting chemotaxis protein